MNCTMPGGDSTTMTKAEMLKAAKAALGDKKPEGVEYPVENRTGETVVVTQEQLPAKAVLVIKANKDCTIELKAGAVIKVLVQGCTNCTVRFGEGSKVTTETTE